MDTSEILISKEEIVSMVRKVADQINQFYNGEELIVIGILTGAFMFTSDLVRALDMPVIVDFMKVSSYKGDSSTGKLNIERDTSYDIKGKNVLIVEDIIDTGLTLKKLIEMLSEREPKTLKICTAFDKKARRVNDLEPDFNGLVVPDEFIVGYGLDYDGRFREFDNVRIVR